LSRCFALSQALAARGAASVWILNDGAKAQAESLGLENAVFMKDPFSDLAAGFFDGADFAVVDSYIPEIGFYEAVAARTKLVAIDDLHDRGVERLASVLVNYSIGARREFYGGGRCKYLLGPRYALLRREYWSVAPEDGDYVLFAPGAADVAGSAVDVAGWWSGGMPRLVIVLGSLVAPEKLSAVRDAASCKNNVKIMPSPPDFVRLLSGAGFVVCTASVTAYEALAMRKRTAVFAVADNQSGLGKALNCMGAACDLGLWADATREKLEAAIKFEPRSGSLDGLVNPKGALGCADAISRISGASAS
jgi:spore coat polysaccharide biosynthesis predicted glycosyltransferase SpsG